MTPELITWRRQLATCAAMGFLAGRRTFRAWDDLAREAYELAEAMLLEDERRLNNDILRARERDETDWDRNTRCIEGIAECLDEHSSLGVTR